MFYDATAIYHNSFALLKSLTSIDERIKMTCGHSGRCLAPASILIIYFNGEPGRKKIFAFNGLKAQCLGGFSKPFAV